MHFFKNLKLKDRILGAVIFMALIFIFVQKIFFSSNEILDNQELVEMMIGDVKVAVKISETVEARYKGLSFQENLAENEGMLFLHENVGRYEYVMRDMKLDLDFVFIRDEEIVDIAKNVSKDFKGIVRGATTYNKVLEIPAGWVDRSGVELGDLASRD
jgi:uncharacterized membrane protein (UPF0127 family)